MIFMNLDSSKKQMQYVLKRARKVAAELTPCGALRREGLSFAIASLEDSKRDLVDQLGQKRPCSQPPMRPSTALPALTLAHGCPLGPNGEPPPLGCRRQAALALGACPKPPIKRPLSI